MENSLDMSLDDLIKSRSNSERGRGRGRARQGRERGRARQGRERERGGTFSRGRASGMLHRGPLRVNARPSANVISKFNQPSSRTNGVPWQRDLFEDSLVAAGYSGSETGTKLYVSNLDLGVTNEDIKELFSEIGELKRYAVHYDRNGRSCGSAEVVFTKRTEALAAMKRYNNVQLDGKAMKIEIIGTGLGLPVSARVNVIGGSNGRGRRTVVMMGGTGGTRGSALLSRGSGRWNRGSFQRGRGLSQGWGQGRIRIRSRGRGRGRGRVRKVQTEKSADELDKDLESYHADAMNTS